MSIKRLITACCLLSILCGFSGAFLFHMILGINKNQPQVLTAKAVVLVSDSGLPIAYWGHDTENRLGLSFYGDTHHQAVTLGVDSGGSPFLEFKDHANKTRLLLQYVSNERPSLVFMDDQSRARVSIGASVSDTPSFGERDNDNWGLLFERPGQGALASVEVWRDPSSKYSSASLAIVDNSRKIWTLPPSESRRPDHK